MVLRSMSKSSINCEDHLKTCLGGEGAQRTQEATGKLGQEETWPWLINCVILTFTSYEIQRVNTFPQVCLCQIE